MQPAQILLVEGTRAGHESWATAIRKAGFEVTTAANGTEAIACLDQLTPDVLIFEASTMRSNGVRTCRRFSRQLPDTPIIHCRAAGQPFDQSAAADVYLVHPFTSRKLLNRIRMVLPANDSEDQIMRLGHLTFYMGKRAVRVGDGSEIPLTPKQAGLLYVFMRQPNVVIGRPQLMRDVWKTDYMGDTRTLDVHIRWLREIIEENPAKPRYLKTVRGKGYILKI